MAAGLGFKTFTTGEVLTAADTNGYLMQGINVFANSAARAAAITSPQEGQYSYLKDTNALEYYDGAAWVGAPVGDITAVTAGKGLTGGGSSGDVTVSLATTAKGDLVAGSGASTAAVLTVGNNGETLVADSSTTTGLRYQGTIAAGRNFVINGAMDIWQRGTSGLGTSTGAYTADRWVLGSSSTTVTRDTDVPTSPYFQYSLKMVGTSDNSIIQRIEASNSTLLAGQTVTFSFYAKRTSGAGALDVRFYYPTTSDTYGAVTQIGSTVVVSASPSSSWTRYSVTAAIGTNITTGLQILINNTGAATTFITGAQLELGSVATNFSRAGGTIQGELAACQRYYVRTVAGTAYGYLTGVGGGNSTTTAVMPVQLPVVMRVAPTSVEYANAQLAQFNGGSFSISSIVLNGQQNTQFGVIEAGGATGLTTDRPTYLRGANNTAGYLGFSAEL